MRFLVATVAVIALCQVANTTPIKSGSCRLVNEPVELFHRIAGKGPDCNVVRISPNIVVLTNPYPENNTDCSISFWTREPNHMEIYPIIADDKDDNKPVRMKTIMANMEYYRAEHEFKATYAPVTQNTFYYDASKDSDSSGFAFVLIAKGSECNYVCKFKEGDKGELDLPEYGPNSYCQSYYKVPKDCTFKLNFDSLQIGDQDEAGDCINDFLSVSKKGEPGYSFRYSEAFCGDLKDKSIESFKNSMSCVLWGDKGGSAGIKGTYEVLCPAKELY